MTDLAALLEGREIDVPTVGSSMWPRLKSGDVVRVAPIPADGPRVGNIVLVARDGGYVLHRVIRLTGNTVLTRGDNQPCPDTPVRPVAVLGVAIARERSGRSVRLGRFGQRSAAWSTLAPLMYRTRIRIFGR